LNNFKVFKNGIELNRTGTGTTRDYSANDVTNVLTLTASLTTSDRLIVQSITGSSPDITTTAEITGAGTAGSPLKLAQQSATSGQVLSWNGSAWIPASVSNSPSIITPTQITSDQDNYNPSGFDDATIVRISSDNFRAITSLVAQSDGERKTFINVGSFPIYFPGQHPDGTAANRIVTGRDHFIFPGRASEMLYDNTTARWVPIQPMDLSYRKGIYYETSFGSITAGDWGVLIFTAGGTAAAAASLIATSNFPGGVSLGTGTTTTGACMTSFAKTATSVLFFGRSHIASEATISIPTLSDGTQTFTAGIQVTQGPRSGTFAPNNTIGIRYTDGVNSGKWLGFSKGNAGAETTVDLGITVAANTVYGLRVEVDKSLSEARFYIDGVMVGRIAANLPNAVSASPRIVIVKSAGTTSRALQAHYFSTEGIY
jgi:hypothetical protein